MSTLTTRPSRSVSAVLRRVASPEWHVYALILVTPLIVYRLPVGGVNLSLQRVFLLLAVATMCAALLDGSRDWRYVTSMLTSRPVRLPLAALAVFIVYEAVRSVPSDQPDYAYRFVGGLVVGFALMTTIVTVLDTPAKLRTGVLTFIASAALPVLVGGYQLLAPILGYAATLPFRGALTLDPIFLGTFQADVGGLLVGRIPSTLAAPAFFGEFLVLVISAVLSLVVGKAVGRPWSLLAVPGLAVATVMLIATISRSAWLLMAAGLLLLVVHARRDVISSLGSWPLSWWAASAATVALTVVLAATTLPTSRLVSSSLDSFSSNTADVPVIPAVPSTVDKAPESAILTLNPPTVSHPGNSSAASTQTHVSLRRDALRVFADHPLAGAGLGNLGPVLRQPAGVSSAQTYGFTVLAEGGIVGFALLVLLLSALLLPVRRAFVRSQGSEERPYLLALYTVVALLSLTNLVLYDTLFRDTSWIALGLAVTAAGLSWRSEQAERHAPSGP